MAKSNVGPRGYRKCKCVEIVGRFMMSLNIQNARFAIEINADIAMLLSMIKKQERQNRFPKKKPIYTNKQK